MSCSRAGRRTRRRAAARSSSSMPARPASPPAVHRQHALHQHHSRRRSSRRSPATRRSSAASRASCAGTRSRWSSAPTSSSDGIGGHISTFASAATLYEVGFNHFFRGRDDRPRRRRHLLPGPRRARHLRPRVPRRPPRRAAARELPPRAAAGRRAVVVPAPVADAGLLGIPDGVDGPRADHGDLPGALHALPRRPRPEADVAAQKVWAFLGDGETDEPESLGAITLAVAREARQPDLRHQLQPAAARRPGARQRPDHPGARGGLPRRGLERHQGASGAATGIRCSSKDTDGLLVAAHGRDRRRRVPEVRRRDRRLHPRALLRRGSAAARAGRAPVATTSCKKLRLGGHDPVKVYAAYKAAVEHKGQPTVILARTIKGYGLGEAGEGKNITHQQKKLNEDELQAFRDRFGDPDLRTSEIAQVAVLPARRRQPGDQYLHERRKALGGYVPSPQASTAPRRSKPTSSRLFEEFYKGTERPQGVDDDGVRARCWRRCCATRRSASWSCRSCPTKRAPSAWSRSSAQVGIYSHAGQLYEPVDMDTLLYYKEAKDGQILEEGHHRGRARCRRSSPRAPPTRRTASTRSRSSSTTRCSASSASAT